MSAPFDPSFAIDAGSGTAAPLALAAQRGSRAGEATDGLRRLRGGRRGSIGTGRRGRPAPAGCPSPAQAPAVRCLRAGGGETSTAEEAGSIEPIAELPDNVIGFEAKGEVTKDDYVQRLIPALEAAPEGPKGSVPLRIGLGFHRLLEQRDVEDKRKFGMEHLTKWERVAVVSDHEWIRHAVNVLGYLIPGEVKAFRLGERSDATAWVTS